MPFEQPVPRDALAFQLATVLEQIDLEVARQQLTPRPRVFTTNAREFLEKVRALCAALGVPAAGPDALASCLRELQRAFGGHEGAGELSELVDEQRHVTQKLRDICIGILGEKARPPAPPGS